MKIEPELALKGGHAQPVHRIEGADLCQLLAISPGMLTQLKQRGVAVHLAHDAYDMAATVTAYVRHLRETASGRGGEEHVSNLTTERARLAKEQADAAALKNQIARREFVPAADVGREWGEVLRKVRSRMLAVPSRIRASLPHLTTADVTAIDREIRTGLEDLAHGND